MSNRDWYIQSTIPRSRGLYPIWHYKVPFIDDLYPRDPAICGINNQGGRNLVPVKNSTDYDDLVGEQTRPLEQDWAIKNDGVGGGVVLPQTIVLTKWAVGFRIESYNKTNLGFIIGKRYSRNFRLV